MLTPYTVKDKMGALDGQKRIDMMFHMYPPQQWKAVTNRDFHNYFTMLYLYSQLYQRKVS